MFSSFVSQGWRNGESSDSRSFRVKIGSLKSGRLEEGVVFVTILNDLAPLCIGGHRLCMTFLLHLVWLGWDKI